MIEIKNKRRYKGLGVLIDRTTIFGNPYSHKPGTLAKYSVESRDDAVDNYLGWARLQWKNNPAYKRAILSLVEKYKRDGRLVLICWCAPKRCHGEIIRDIIIRLTDGG